MWILPFAPYYIYIYIYIYTDASSVAALETTSEGRTVKDKGKFDRMHNSFTTPLWSISWILTLCLCYSFLIS